MGIQDGKSLGRGLDNMLGKGRNLLQCDAIVSLLCKNSCIRGLRGVLGLGMTCKCQEIEFDLAAKVATAP